MSELPITVVRYEICPDLVEVCERPAWRRRGSLAMTRFAPPDYWNDEPLFVCGVDGPRPVVSKAKYIFDGEET